MNMETVLMKILDIFVSNFFIALGWVAAFGLGIKFATRGWAKFFVEVADLVHKSETKGEK